MVGERLFEIMGDIDESYVISAVKPIKKKHYFFRYAAAVAACALLATMRFQMAGSGGNSKNAGYDAAPGNSAPAYQQITEYNSYDGLCGDDNCYKAPHPGEYYCHIDVNEAREHYKGENVEFVLTFDLFKEGEEQKSATMTKEEIDAEWNRLASLGIETDYVEHWEYKEDTTDKALYTERVCIMTEAQLENFGNIMNPDYGYAFRFVKNGDGSAAADTD